MQDTTIVKKMRLTPEELATTLHMELAALQKVMSRLDITGSKDEPLSKGELAAILAKQGQPHHLRAPETVNAAQALAEEMNLNLDEVEESGQPAPSPAPATEKPKKKKKQKPEKRAEPIQSNSTKTNWLYEASKGIFVALLIAAQAWVYACLADIVLNGAHEGGAKLPFAAAFLVGCLIESAGVMIARQMKPGDSLKMEYQKDEVRAKRGRWLFAFFAFQLVIDCAFIGLFGSWSALVGQWAIALSIPGGILAYSHLYLKD